MKNNFKDLSIKSDKVVTNAQLYKIFTSLLSVYFKVVKTLLESSKCKLDIKTKLGHTPLHEAAKQVTTLYILPLLMCTIVRIFYAKEGPFSCNLVVYCATNLQWRIKITCKNTNVVPTGDRPHCSRKCSKQHPKIMQEKYL